MASKKHIKELNRELKALSKSMPKLYSNIECRGQVLGEQLIKHGITTIPDTMMLIGIDPKTKEPIYNEDPIKKDGRYTVPVRGGHQVNHFKKLKQMYKAGGIDKVLDYTDGVVDLELQSRLPQTFGGITTRTR
jgi:hypothetical protein